MSKMTKAHLETECKEAQAQIPRLRRELEQSGHARSIQYWLHLTPGMKKVKLVANY